MSKDIREKKRGVIDNNEVPGGSASVSGGNDDAHAGNKDACGSSEAKAAGGSETERRILRAAEREFMAKGFAGARTQAIAEAAGVNHAMLHYYFRSKELLFERITAEKFEMLSRLLAPSIEDTHSSIFQMLRKIINSHLDFIAKNPELPRFILMEIYSNPERLRQISDKVGKFAPQIVSNLQRRIDKAARAGLCRMTDARKLLLDILSLNILPFMAAPIINAAFNGYMEDIEAFVTQRKQENYDTIMCKLKL